MEDLRSWVFLFPALWIVGGVGGTGCVYDYVGARDHIGMLVLSRLEAFGPDHRCPA